MKEYLVEWSIEITAESPEGAARQAWAIVRAEDSRADHFEVTLAECVQDDAPDGDAVVSFETWNVNISELDDAEG
jgi:hypothetical protein